MWILLLNLPRKHMTLIAPESVRTDLLCWKVSQLMEHDVLDLATLEALDNGKIPTPTYLQKYLYKIYYV
jgi:hypothetical protein